ncbi:MAG: TrkA family potassium uptake protein [Candidatus Eisenbacteria bacterium]|uniref:Trk system potassium uptake protein TrkA n=1 Tax=Eiseniibacteriota bacterium TaxID=2212470 RepID=A0A948RUE9_UNCEI|nr:TrkA family potassium uptake protein [Candidatus Eisenbacteria bacterium]MBU1949597.1 TrkA family potassium uptake protein [Candidatus Eisenbacteria bacterium]MBU2690741.1 TrkA family potassium uptake protein [Candidatus Eisenbacteria bacterium]
MARRVLIAGEGRLLYFLARRFQSSRSEVTVICPHLKEAERLSRRLKCLVVHGDPTQPRFLEEAGAGKADDVIAATGRDEDNLVICQLAAQHFEVLHTVAVVQDPDFVDAFRKLGVGAVISTTDMLARLVEKRTSLEGLEDLAPAAGQGVIVSDVLLKETDHAAGHRLDTLELPESCLVGSVIRGEKMLIPKGDFLFAPGDRAIILVTPEVEEEAIRILKEGR